MSEEHITFISRVAFGNEGDVWALSKPRDVRHSHRHEHLNSSCFYFVACRPTGGKVYEYSTYCGDDDALLSVGGTDCLLDPVSDIFPVLIRRREVDTYIDFLRKAVDTRYDVPWLIE